MPELRAPTLLLLAAVLASIHVPLVIAEDQAGYLHIDRKITPSYGGLVYVVDEITGHGGTNLTYGIPAKMVGVLEWIGAEGAELQRVDGNEKVVLYTVVPRDEKVRIVSIYKSLIAGLGNDMYVISIVPYPYVEGKRVNASITLLRYGDISYASPPEGWREGKGGLVREVLITDVGQLTLLTFEFTSTSFALFSIERLEFLYDFINDVLRMTIELRNLTPKDIGTVSVSVPKGLTVERVYDTLGSLQFQRSDGTISVIVGNLRYPLKQGWKFSFTIDLKGGSNVGLFGSKDGVANIVPFTPINASLSSVSYTFVLPPSSKPNLASSPDELYYSPSGNTIVRIIGEPSDVFSSRRITLPYVVRERMQIAPWLLVAGVLMLGIGLLRLKRPKAARPLPPLEHLKVVIEEMGRIGSLANEIVSSVERGKTSRDVYASIQERLSSIRRSRAKLLERIEQVKKGSPPSRINRVIEVVDSLYESSRAIVKNYEDLIKGSIARSSFDKMCTPLKKEIRRNVAELIELSRELGSQ